MNRIISALLIIAMIVLLSACAAKPAEPTEPTKPQQETTVPAAQSSQATEPEPEKVVVFTDPVLEELIRKALNRPDGDITLAEAEATTELNLEMEGGVPIPRVEDISDIVQFPNLTSLNLNWALYEPNCNMDISPLAALTRLECLYICCDNISDISALSGLTNLKDLWIWGNGISDISALAGMTKMRSIWMKTNQISDISSLAGMKDLILLYMEDNQISDLSPLAGLTKLKNILLSGNLVTDYSPLADVYPNLAEKDFEMSKLYRPLDIFGDEFNPCGMARPDCFKVFSASFDKGCDKFEGKSLFVLSMTGSGDMLACVAYHADVAGLSEEETDQRINEYLEGGFCRFHGKDGRIVNIDRANPEDDRYEYVEADGTHGQTGAGCVITITYFLDDADTEKYTQLVRDTYSVGALAPIADFFDTHTDFAECGIDANLHKDEAHTYVVYRLPDVKSVQQSMQAKDNTNWWEWNGMIQTAFTHNGVESKLIFDSKDKAITVDQLHTKLCAPPAATGSLSALGFVFDDAETCGVYEEREPHYKSVAIARPEWGEHPDNWNIEFMDTDINGYGLRITYHVDEGKYRVGLSKDKQKCDYECYPDKDERGWEHPDLDTVQRMFNDAFGTKAKELYYKPLEYFEQFVQERFGLSVQQLYAAPKR